MEMTMTTEEKANAYNKVLKKVKDLISRCKNDTDRRTMIYRVEDIESILTELAESEDEKIRKAIISGMTALKDQGKETFASVPINDCIAWLEKQGEQRPILDFKAKDWYVSKVDGKIHNIYHSVDKVEPKFEVGDWLVHNERKHIIKVVNHTPLVYEVVNILGYHHTITNTAIENNYHLWTIQDAKDGDVLIDKSSSRECPFIFKETKPSDIKTDMLNPLTVLGYCGIGGAGFTKGDGWGDTTNCICYPATKEQRDTLFKAMNEAGYTFDFEKKELKLLISNGGDFESDDSEQKPTWSDEDENVLEDIEEAIINYWHGDTQNILLDWLKSLKERLS